MRGSQSSQQEKSPEDKTSEALNFPKGARGRKDQGQEKVIQMEKLSVRLDDLVSLKKKADDSADEFAEAIKTVAEAAGLLSSTVRKFVSVRAGERYEEEMTKAKQLVLCFEEIGESK